MGAHGITPDAFVIFKDGVTTVTLRYVEAKANGSFQYRRRIPLDVQQHYDGKPVFVRSLKRDPKQLAPEAGRITARLDAEWMALRSKIDGADPDSVVIPAVSEAESYFAPAHAFSVQRSAAAQPTILISEALKLYLAHHPKGHLAKFRVDNERIIALVIDRLGNLPLDAYTRQHASARVSTRQHASARVSTRQHAEELRDRMPSKNLTGSVRRRLNSLTAIFNKARKEKQL